MMATKTYSYPADSSLEDLRQTCQADEVMFRARLINLGQAVVNNAKANQATFESIGFNEPYVKKNLYFHDINSAIDQVPPDYGPVFKAQVFLNNQPATIAVYREQ